MLDNNFEKELYDYILGSLKNSININKINQDTNLNNLTNIQELVDTKNSSLYGFSKLNSSRYII